MQNTTTLNTAAQLRLLEAVNAIAPGSAIFTVSGELAPTPMKKIQRLRLAW